MTRGVKRFFKERIPKVEELGRQVKIPEVPKTYRQKLWRTIKVKTTLKLPEETEHFMNILCLHFGISRNELVLHAINLLWGEVVETVDIERIKAYEDKLEAVRLWRLENREVKDSSQKARLEQAIAEWHRQGTGGKTRTNKVGTSWKYHADKPVRDWKAKKKPVIVYEEDDEPKEG